MITSSNYEDIKFLNVLDEMYNIHPHNKFNTFDVVMYTKPTDEKLEENEFTFRLMTGQYNGPHDLDMLNIELETRMQEREMNQSDWSMQRFVKRKCIDIGFILLVVVLLSYHSRLDIYLIYIILIINVFIVVFNCLSTSCIT